MHQLLFATSSTTGTVISTTTTTTGTVISTTTTTIAAATMPSSCFSSSSSCSSSPSSSSSNSKSKSSNHAHNSNCNSHSATLDLLILILVLFSGAFLLSSYLSYIFNTISLLYESRPQLFQFPIPYILGFFIFFVISVIVIEFCCGARSRKCNKPGCKGLKKAMEFDLQLQTEDCVKSGSNEIDKLPWKGNTEDNPDYECLRSELRNMAPPNGRAVLLFRARCGCPIAKLEGWGPKKGKRHKKSPPNATLNGGGDHL